VQIERLHLAFVTEYDIRHLNKLCNLRELSLLSFEAEIGTSQPGGTLIILDHVEEFRKLLRLEQLTLAGCDIKSFDLRFLCDLPTLHELDLSHCSNMDDDAAPYLKKMKGLRRLNLEGTKISDAIAESIDDALPDCEVLY
jgi:hypothetical protein